MQEHVCSELAKAAEIDLIKEEFSKLDLKIEAERSIQKHIQQMKDDNKLLILTDEEEQMLRAFRAFKGGIQANKTFKWATDPA